MTQFKMIRPVGCRTELWLAAVRRLNRKRRLRCCCRAKCLLGRRIIAASLTAGSKSRQNQKRKRAWCPQTVSY